jgi:hypothetical protein
MIPTNGFLCTSLRAAMFARSILLSLPKRNQAAVFAAE